MFFDEKTALQGSRIGLSNCSACKLSRTCESPEMSPSGQGEKGILIIGEAPGAADDRQGMQFVGESGQRLRSILSDSGIDMDRDCRKMYAVNCRPPDSREPTAAEIDACRPRVWEEIYAFKPKLILLLGHAAVVSFLGHRWKKDLGGIAKWRGHVIPDPDARSWAMATYSPSYLLRSQNNPAIETVFRQDIRAALGHLGKTDTGSAAEYPAQPSGAGQTSTIPANLGQSTCSEDSIRILRSAEESVALLKLLYQDLRSSAGGLMAFDYEMTGLKPYDKGHEIVCCGVSTGDRTFVFEMMADVELRRWWKRILMEKRIAKSAHNMRFEDSWTNVILGHPVAGWKWCSMLAAHVLDNRPDICGLKFQAYINFGIVDYSSKLEPYLKTAEGVKFNRVREAPLKDLMQYCGMDALLQYRLAVKQMVEVGFR